MGNTQKVEHRKREKRDKGKQEKIKKIERKIETQSEEIGEEDRDREKKILVKWNEEK